MTNEIKGRYIIGHSGYWKGKTFSEEHKKRISEGNMGKIIPLEVRKKMSEYWSGRERPERRGIPLTEETKKKISLSNTGTKNGMFGRRYNHMEETKRKISSAKKKYYESHQNHMTGRVRPEISEMLKRLWKQEKYKILFTKKALKRRIPTSFEVFVSEIIKKNELPYKYVGNGSFWLGGMNPDFIDVNGKRVCIEVYCSYFKLKHYISIEEFKKDRTQKFAEYNWRVIFIDENELNEKSILNKIMADGSENER